MSRRTRRPILPFQKCLRRSMPRQPTRTYVRVKRVVVKTRVGLVRRVGRMSVVPVAQTATLLAQADRLPYPERMALQATRARAWAGTTTLDGVLADLSADREHRELAVYLAVVAGHGPAIRAALT